MVSYRFLTSLVFWTIISSTLTDDHQLIYNNDIVYYDECRITVSPKIHSQPVRAYVQVQKPCNGSLLWTYPNSNLTLTLVNLENDIFTICFERKILQEKLIRSILIFNGQSDGYRAMKEMSTNNVAVLCAPSQGNQVSIVIEAEPIYAGVHLRYAMFNDRHPWTAGPFPGWQRSEKYLYGPQAKENKPTKSKKIRPHRKMFK